MTALSTAWILARKDLRLFFRDRAALALTLALPILLATIFGSAMQGMMGGGGEGSPIKKVKLLVEDLDESAASARLVEAIEGADAFEATVTTDARRQVAGGDYPAAVVIPRGYGEVLARGEVPPIALLRDPSQYIALQAVSFGLLPVLMGATLEHVGPDFMATVLRTIDFPESGRDEAERALRTSWEEMDVVIQRLVAEGAFDGGEAADAGEPEEEPDDESDEVGFDMAGIPSLLGVQVEDVVGGGDDDGPPRSAGVSHAIASMAVMMLMFSLVAAGATLLEEHDTGTLERLQLAPSAGTAIVLGKMTTLALIGLLQLVILYAYGMAVFDVPLLERPFALAVTSLALVFAVVGLGMLFAVTCRTQKQLEGLSTLVILVMSAVGGAWFPREITPDWFQIAGLFTLTAYAMDAFHGVLWYGKGLLPTGELDGVWPQVAILVGVGAALTALSARLFRRRFVDGA